MRIAVATSPLFFVEENAIIQALFEEGLDILHLSKPDSEPIYCERLLTLMPQRWCSRIVTSDHFYLQGEYGLKGIHLSQRNPEMPRGYRGYVSRSCSTEDLGKYSEQYGHLVLEATPSAIEQAVRERKINHRVFMRELPQSMEFSSHVIAASVESCWKMFFGSVLMLTNRIISKNW